MDRMWPTWAQKKRNLKWREKERSHCVGRKKKKHKKKSCPPESESKKGGESRKKGGGSLGKGGRIEGEVGKTIRIRVRVFSRRQKKTFCRKGKEGGGDRHH